MINQEKLEQRPHLWTRQYILVVLTTLSLYLGYMMLPSTMPLFVLERLGGKETIAGTIIGFLTFAAVITRPFAGRLADTYGRRKVYLTGLVICFLSVAAYNFVPNVTVLLILRLIHGVGWGLSTTAINTMASDSIPQSRLAEGMAYFVVTSNFAMAISPAGALALISGGNFANMFAISSLLLVLAFGLGLSLRTSHIKMDNVKGQSAGLLRSLFETKALLSASIVCLTSMTYAAVTTFIPVYARGVGIGNIGTFYTVYAVTQVLVRSFTGRVGDKKGLGALILPGLLGGIAAMLILYKAHFLYQFLLAALVCGLGFGVVYPALQVLALRYVTPQRRGAANATYLNGVDLGLAVGTILAGAVAESVGIKLMFLLSIVPVAIGMILYLLSYKKLKSAGQGKNDSYAQNI